MIMLKHNKKVRNSTPAKRPTKHSELNHAALLADLAPILKACGGIRDKYLKRSKDAQKSVEMYRAKIKKLDAKLPVFTGDDPHDPRYFLHAHLSAHYDIKDLYDGLAADLEYKPAAGKNTYATCPELSNLISTRPWDFSAFDSLSDAQAEEDKLLAAKDALPVKKAKAKR